MSYFLASAVQLVRIGTRPGQLSGAQMCGLRFVLFVHAFAATLLCQGFRPSVESLKSSALQLGSSVCSHAISTSGCCGQAVKNTHCLHPELSCCLLKIPSHRDRNRAISLLSPGQAQSMNLPGCHRYGCWCYYSTVTKCSNFSNRTGPRFTSSPGGVLQLFRARLP